MFFEEESKDTHGNMDDYDLDFEQDESVSWDKLLDDNDSSDESSDLLSEEKAEADDDISIADNLLDMDDESFDNFIQEQKQNIIKNRDEGDFDVLSDEDDLKFDITQDDDDITPVVSDDDLLLEETSEDVMPVQEEIEETPAPVEETVEPQEEQLVAEEADDALELEDEELVFEEPEAIQEETVETAEEIPLEEPEAVVEEETVAEVSDAEELGLEDLSQEPEIEIEGMEFEEEAEASDEDTNSIEAAFGVEGDEETDEIDLDEFLGEDTTEDEEPKEKKAVPFLPIVAGVAVVFLLGFFIFTKVINKSDVAFDANADTSAVSDVLDATALENITTDGADVPQVATDATAPQTPADAPALQNAGNSDVVNIKVSQSDKQPTTVAVKPEANKAAKKADKKPQEEKINLRITDSGRQTPFVPVAGVNNLGFATTPKLDIAKPFNTLAAPDPMFDKLMNIVVSGILYDGSQNPSAVINVSGTDYFVQKGDKIDTFTVIGITEDTVVIKEKNNVFSATIGQSFTTLGSIDGEIQTVNSNNRQIQRLYKSSYGGYMTQSSQSSNDYQSLDDIGINTKH